MIKTNKLHPTTINIKNFKSIWNIENLNIEAPIMPIIGINGAGKSNILRAIDWFVNEENNYEETSELKNIYVNSDESDETIVDLIFNFSKNDNKTIIESAMKEFKAEVIDEFFNADDLDVPENKELKKSINAFITEVTNEEGFKISKIETANEYGIYTFSRYLEEFVTNVNFDIEEMNEWISEWIYKKIIKDRMINIYLLDTKKTLNEFELQNKKSGDDFAIEVDSNEFAFSQLFKFTEFINKDEDKYKLISKILERVDGEVTFEDFINLTRAALETGTTEDKIRGERLYTLINNFSNVVTTNAFFRSINSDSAFRIYPQYKGTYFENGDNNHKKSGYKLILEDVVVDFDGNINNIPVENLGFKNDGFIFALMLTLQIEFLFEDDSIILIDEPANFLSIPSTRLLMENFKRISNDRNMGFIFTTHSPYTLDKNIVKFEDIKIATKGKDFCTNLVNLSEGNSESLISLPEFEIIKDQYSANKKGVELIDGTKNFLVEAKDEITSELIKFISHFSNYNWVPMFNLDILKNNLKLYKEVDKTSKDFSYVEPLKINFLDSFDAEEIAELFHDKYGNESTFNFVEFKKNENYKKEMILELLRLFSNKPDELKNNLPKTSSNILEILDKEEKKYASNISS